MLSIHIPDEQKDILLAHKPEIRPRFWCMHCLKDRAATDRRFKVVMIRATPHRQVRCKFCTWNHV